MRYTLLLGMLVMTLNTTFAQTLPTGIHYQAVMRDSSDLMANQSMLFTFTLYQKGEAIYAETHTLRTNEFGLINTIIGQGTPILNDWLSIKWDSDQIELGVIAEMDEELYDLGQHPFWSVPYALSSAYSNLSSRSDTSTYSENTAPISLSQLIDVEIGTPDSAHVLTWDGTTWVARPVPLGQGGSSMQAGDGIEISNGTIINTGDLDPNDDVQIGSNATGDLSGTYPNPRVVALDGLPLVMTTPAMGDRLTWDGSAWVSEALPPLQNLVAGAGIAIQGNDIVNTGDIDPNDDLLMGSSANGDLSGTFPNPSVSAIDGYPLTLTSPSAGDRLTWNGSAWVSEALPPIQTLGAGTGIALQGNNIVNTGDIDPNDDLLIGSSANGDLSGTFPNPSVSAIDGYPLTLASPSAGDRLTWNGTAWVAEALPPTLGAGNGITIQGNNIVNTGDLDPNDDILIGSLATGDLTGTYPAPTVRAIMGRTLSSLAPTPGQTLKWTGTTWQPADDLDSGSPWTASGSNIRYTTGHVGIGTTQTNGELNLGGDLRGWHGSSQRLRLNPTSSGGVLELNGSSSSNFVLGQLSGNNNLPSMSLRNQNSFERASFAINSEGAGEVLLRGVNGSLNVRMNNLIGFPNNGYISVRNSSGNVGAGMYVNGSGQGIIFGDQKNFRIQHPTRPDKEIWYGSLEGPELAAYVRGNAELVNGEAWIEFPEHFRLIANPETMTVILTPNDRSSEGLAVIEKTANGIRVGELRNGSGSYTFDWEVKCVRKGHEDFEVIRDPLELAPTEER